MSPPVTLTPGPAALASPAPCVSRPLFPGHPGGGLGPPHPGCAHRWLHAPPTGVFTECCREDREQAEKLLTRVSEAWGGSTCLQLALDAGAMQFMAQGGVQVAFPGPILTVLGAGTQRRPHGPGGGVPPLSTGSTLQPPFTGNGLRTGRAGARAGMVWGARVLTPPCPQAYLTKVWWGELQEDTGLWRVALCLLTFPLLCTSLVTFRCAGQRAGGASTRGRGFTAVGVALGQWAGLQGCELGCRDSGWTPV